MLRTGSGRGSKSTVAGGTKKSLLRRSRRSRIGNINERGTKLKIRTLAVAALVAGTVCRRWARLPPQAGTPFVVQHNGGAYVTTHAVSQGERVSYQGRSLTVGFVKAPTGLSRAYQLTFAGGPVLPQGTLTVSLGSPAPASRGLLGNFGVDSSPGGAGILLT